MTGKPTFDELAAKLREMTRARRHTPAEELMREGRDERVPYAARDGDGDQGYCHTDRSKGAR